MIAEAEETSYEFSYDMMVEEEDTFIDMAADEDTGHAYSAVQEAALSVLIDFGFAVINEIFHVF